MQCKDISDTKFLQLCVDAHPKWVTWWLHTDGLPKKLVLAKWGQLKRRGLVDGCTCGCRGDFVLTPKGRAYMAAPGRNTKKESDQCPNQKS